MGSKHLTDSEVWEMQQWYQKHRYRGSIQALMQRYGRSRNAILAALSKTVLPPAEKPSVLGGETAGQTGVENACACTEATDPKLTLCGHPVTCRCRGCRYHNMGLIALVDGKQIRMDRFSLGVA